MDGWMDGWLDGRGFCWLGATRGSRIVCRICCPRAASTDIERRIQKIRKMSMALVASRMLSTAPGRHEARALEPSRSFPRHDRQPLGAHGMRSDGSGRRWNCKIVFWKAPGGVGIAQILFWRVPGGAGTTKIVFWRAPGGAGTTKIVVSVTPWSATAGSSAASNGYPGPHQSIHFLYDSHSENGILRHWVIEN